MARLPRIVIPDYPHHVTQHGNRRSRIFFEGSGYKLYDSSFGEVARKAEE